MKEKTIAKDMWESAGYAGLALGLVSAAYMFINNALSTSDMSGGLATLIVMLAWMAKFAGCIILMKYFMKKFSASHPEATNKDTFKMGVKTSLLSALLFSAIQFADMVYISADTYKQQFETAMQTLGPQMDANTLKFMKDYFEMMPEFSFFGNLIYCFLFGTVVSSIISRNIPSKDPFADYKPDEQ